MSEDVGLMSTATPTREYVERRRRPILWWEVAALQQPATQVFRGLFAETLGEADRLCREIGMELRMREAFESWSEPPMILFDADLRPEERGWGADGEWVEAWFAEARDLERGIGWPVEGGRYVEPARPSLVDTLAHWLGSRPAEAL